MNILKVFTRARRIGNLGEDAAARLLRRKGYRILERGYVALGNEIDIIAENRTHTVFVEVKTRSYGDSGSKWESRPAAAVTPEKMAAIIKVAKCYLAYKSKQKQVRFDIIEVYTDGESKIKRTVHIENAFRQERRNYK